MKIDWNRKYTTIAVYAVLVVVASLVCYNMLHNFTSYKAAFRRMIGILLPVIYGFSIAFVLNPVECFFEKKVWPRVSRGKLSAKWNRGIAVFSTYVVAILVIAVFLSVVIPQVTSSIAGIVSNLSAYFNGVTGWLNSLSNMLPKEEIFQETLEKINESAQTILEAFYSWLSALLPMALNATKNLTTGLTNLVLGIIISIYFLFGKERFFAQLKKVLYALFPQDFVKRLIDVTHTSNRIFSGFISGKLLDSLIIGILCFVGMSLFRMPMAMLVSVIVGVTNVIPYFGPFIGAIPSALIVFLVDPIKALWFVLFVIFLQQFDGNILGPRILGDSIGLPAFWVIFAILLFGGYFGVFGMFVGVPAFAVIYSVLKIWMEGRLSRKNMPTDTKSYASEDHPLL
ncbi:MAG TPA: AI-2E family transporter [Ruminococcaceae bacterium]|nr:AI-2E family transporter [Oscillospiraceae bacterium]HCB64839.1 AI-2E family transporter [Oscillospiraceae bacterium]